MTPALLALALLQAPAPAQQGLPDSTRVALNRGFATWTSTNGPGCAAGVSRNGELVFQNGYGMANLEHDIPITPASIFHVASVSKQFTAMAVMLLAADGKLSLDDDIRKHLPELPDYGHHRPPMPRRAPMRNRLHRGRGHLARAGSARHHSRAVHPWRSNAEAVRSAGAPGRSGARPAHARNPGYFRPRRRQLRVHLLRRQRRLSPGGLERLS